MKIANRTSTVARRRETREVARRLGMTDRF
jgi:hypothetical protein